MNGSPSSLRTALRVLALAAMLGGMPASAAGVDRDAVAEQVIREVNGFRRAEGRGTLRDEPRLAAAAQDFAAYMARTGRFTHEADGRQPAQRAEQHGYAYCIVLENIAWEQRSPDFASGELARALVEGWKGSPVHRRNMLDADVVDTGVGLVQNTDNRRWHAVQLFGAGEATRVRFSVTNEAGIDVRYRLGDRTFDLPALVTRTHQQCRSGALVLDGAVPATSAQPKPGTEYVVRGSPGALRFDPRDEGQ